MSIRTNYGYRCPKCLYTWDNVFTKDYNGSVYCKGKRCGHRFKNEKIKVTGYSFYEYTHNRDEMIGMVEEFLAKLKATDNQHDFSVSEEFIPEKRERGRYENSFFGLGRSS